MTRLSKARQFFAYSLYAASLSAAEIQTIDLAQTKDLIAWKAEEPFLVGALTVTPKFIFYAVAERPEIPSKSPAKTDSLLRTHLLCRWSANGALQWTTSFLSDADRYQYPSGLPPLSAPFPSGHSVFVQSADGQVAAFAAEGFVPGKNRGPFRWEQNLHPGDADILWTRDLPADLHVVPKNVGDIGEAIAQPLAIGERVYITTGNGGVASGHGGRAPNLSAPAFVALSAKDGSVLWQNNDPSPACSFYQNAGPFRVSAEADPKTIGFPGGDGFLYLLDAGTGKTLKKLPCFPPDSIPWTKDKEGTRNFFTIPPTVALPYVLTCPGWTIEMVGAERPGRRTPLYAFRMNGDRDATLAWSFDDERFMGTAAPLLVEKDEVFVLGYPDRLLVLDLATGRKKREAQLPETRRGHAGMALWKDRLIVCLEDIHIFTNDAQFTHLLTLNAGEATSMFSQPVIQDDRLIVSTGTTLWALDLAMLEKLFP